MCSSCGSARQTDAAGRQSAEERPCRTLSRGPGSRAPATPVGLPKAGTTRMATDRAAMPETILRRPDRQIEILVADERLTVTHARFCAGERVAGPHIHHDHTDSFYVLAGELIFEIGCEAEAVTLSAGGFLAVPPRVPHAFRVGSRRPARWLTVHTPDGGFAAFMRSIRDGGDVDWDIHPVG